MLTELKLKAHKYAQELIREMVEDGRTLSEIASSYVGKVTKNYHASVGGWNDDLGAISNKKIIVKTVEGKEVFELFSLREIYNSIKKQGNQLTLF